MHGDQTKKMYVVLHEFSGDICSYSYHQTTDKITITCCPSKMMSGKDSKIQRISYKEVNKYEE